MIIIYDVVCLVVFWTVFAALGWSLGETAESGWTVSFGEGDISNPTIISNSSNASHVSGSQRRGVDVADSVPFLRGGFFDKLYAGGGNPFGLVDTDKVWSMLPIISIMAMVGPVFNTAIGIAAIQAQTHQNSDLDAEFIKLGCGHIVSGCLGGFASASDNVESAVFESNGGKTRASVFVLSALYLAILVVPYLHQFAVIIPYPMLGGMYFYLGFEGLWENLGPHQKNVLNKIEYAMIWAMLVLYVSTGQNLIYPIALGVGWAILIFLHMATSQRVIFFQGSASNCPSFSEHTMKERTSLESGAAHSYVVRLTGMLSFAQVKQLASDIETLCIASLPAVPIRRLLCDFEMVQTIDTSAGIILNDLFDNLEALGVHRIVIIGAIDAKIRSQFERHCADKIEEQTLIFHPTFDRACDYLEQGHLNIDRLLSASMKRRPATGTSPLAATLQRHDVEWESRTPAQKCAQTLRLLATWVRAARSPKIDAGRVFDLVFRGSLSRAKYPAGNKLVPPPNSNGPGVEKGEREEECDTDGVWLLLSGSVVGLWSQDVVSMGAGDGDRGEGLVPIVFYSGIGLLLGAGVYGGASRELSFFATSFVDTFWISHAQMLGCPEVQLMVMALALDCSSSQLNTARRKISQMRQKYFIPSFSSSESLVVSEDLCVSDPRWGFVQTDIKMHGKRVQKSVKSAGACSSCPCLIVAESRANRIHQGARLDLFARYEAIASSASSTVSQLSRMIIRSFSKRSFN